MYRNLKKCIFHKEFIFDHYVAFINQQVFLLCASASALKMSAGVEYSTGAFTYPLCPMQGMLAGLVMFCVGGADSVHTELVPTTMDGDDGAEGVCEHMGDDDGEEGVCDCMGDDDGEEGVSDCMGGKNTAEGEGV